MQRFKKRARLLTEQLGGTISYGHDDSLTVTFADYAVQFALESADRMRCHCAFSDSQFAFTTRQDCIFDIIDCLSREHLRDSLRDYESPRAIKLSDYITEENAEALIQDLRDRLDAEPYLQYAELGGNCLVAEYVGGFLIIRDDLCRGGTNVVGLKRSSAVVQHVFYARPSAHLPTLATGHGLDTISVVQTSFASFRAVSKNLPLDAPR